MQLIDNWRDTWKFYSTHAYTITLATGAALAWLSKEHPDLYQLLPGWVLVLVGFFLFFSFLVSRVVKQATPDAEVQQETQP